MPSRLRWRLFLTSYVEPRRSAGVSVRPRAGRLQVALCSAVLALTAASGVEPSHAQSKRAMTLVDLLNIPRVSIDPPDITRDGRHIVFTLQTTDWSTNRRVPQIWTINGDGTGLHRLTSSDAGSAGGRWSPDGASLAFISRGAIFVISVAGGTPRQISRHATSVLDFAWQPDGKFLYFLATDAPSDAERARDKRRGDVQVLDEFRQRHLWKVAVADGTEQRITSGDYSIFSFKVASSGALVVVRAPSPTVPDATLRELWLMKPDGTSGVQLTHNGIEEADAMLSPDGSQVLFLARANDRQEPYYNANVFLIPATGGTPRAIVPDFQYEVLRTAWSDDGRSVLSVVNMGVHTELFRFDVATHSAKQLTNGDHQITPLWSVAADRQVFVVDEPSRIGDIWTMAPGATAPTRVSSIYDYLERDFALPRQERIQWKGADGVVIEGILTYPIGYTSGKRYPMVVQMHGGPEDSDRFGWGTIYLNYQPAWAARGYAVLRPNYRGSSGYGNAFYREPIGGYFKNSHLDVLAGVDRVISMGVADPDRLAVMGWSAGGHLVNKLITFTDRFKAAASYAGVANWISLYGETDTRGNRDLWFGGSLWMKNAPIQTYWDQSPLKYVSAAHTPTIFFIGEDDPRVPMSQSVEMSRALKSQGVPSELHVAPGEGHIWGKPEHQLYKMNTEIEWVEKYTQHLPYTPEEIPTENDAKVIPAP